MLTIARLTFKEALRKRILAAAVILTLLFLALYGTGLHFVARELKEAEARLSEAHGMNPDMMIEGTKRMLLVLGIYFSSWIVSVLAVFSSVGSIAAEIENGMLHAVLAKPVKRRDVVLGKFIGYALMLTVYAALLFGSILGLNYYLTGASANGAAGAIGLFVMQPLVLLALTIAGSTRLSTLANGITAFMVYMIGLIGGMVEWVGVQIQNTSVVNAGVLASLLMPADALYRKIVVALFGTSTSIIDSFSFGPFGAASEPSTAMVVYALLYIAGFLLLAVVTFTRRDIG